MLFVNKTVNKTEIVKKKKLFYPAPSRIIKFLSSGIIRDITAVLIAGILFRNISKHFSRALCRISNVLRNIAFQNYCIIHCCTIVCHCEYISSLSLAVEIHVRMLWKYRMGILCSLATVCYCCIMYNYYLTDVKININSHWVL